MAIISPLKVDRAANIFSFFFLSFDGGMKYGVFLNALPLQWALPLPAPLAVAGFLLSLLLFLARQQFSVVCLHDAFDVFRTAV